MSELDDRVSAIEDRLQQMANLETETAYNVTIKVDEKGKVEPAVKERAGLMTFGGFWDREEEYEENEIVLFKNRLFVNIAKVAKFVNNLGLPITIKANGGHIPNYTLTPRGLIVAGYKPSDILLPSDPRVEDQNNATETVEGQVRGHLWEFIQKTPGGKIKVLGHNTEDKLGKAGGVALFENPETGILEKKCFNPNDNLGRGGMFKVAIVTDLVEEGTLHKAGILWDGPEEGNVQSEGFDSTKFFEEHAAATHKFYMIVSGATREPPGPPFSHRQSTLPWPYELETEIANLVSEPGNLTPPEDPEHWLVLP